MSESIVIYDCDVSYELSGAVAVMAPTIRYATCYLVNSVKGFSRSIPGGPINW